MAYNITAIDALELTFNEQTTVIAISFVASLMSSIMLAGCLFGVCKNVEIGLPEMEAPEWEEWSCCIFCNYIGMRYCRGCCCTNWRKRWKDQISKMQQELYDQELEETKALEARETEEREEKERKWLDKEKEQTKNK